MATTLREALEHLGVDVPAGADQVEITVAGGEPKGASLDTSVDR